MQRLTHVDLSAWHTLRAPACAHSLYLLDSPEEVAALPAEVLLLGGGSNILFVGEIARPLAKLTFAAHGVHSETAAEVFYEAEAGAQWSEVVDATVALGLSGLEALALIPGTVGAAPVQNIGAYGRELKDALDSVTVFDLQQRRHLHFQATDCAFAYRQSLFKRAPHYLITKVRFRLQRRAHTAPPSYPELQQRLGENPSPEAIRSAVIALRRQKLPDPQVLPNAGSFFHNPIVAPEVAARLPQAAPRWALPSGQLKISAAWLIEQCGLRGYNDGPVGMYAGHALILINRGGSGAEILRFAHKVQREVYARFALRLDIEPTIIGAVPHE